MSRSPRASRTTPSRFLPLIMLLVLLGAIAAAWTLVRQPGEGIATAADIIADIREKGLSTYWGSEPVMRWYLIHDRGRPVGWQVMYRQPAADGGFQGGEMQVRKGPQGQTIQDVTSWQLNADTTWGSYIAEHRVANSPDMRMLTAANRTEIKLDDERLRIVQFIDGREHVSGAPTPPGYIPEGVQPLAMAMAARRKTNALFRMIGNDVPPHGNYPRFLRMNMQYLGPPEDQPGRVMMELATSLEGATLPKQTFILDRQGTVVNVLLADYDIERVLSSQQDILDALPWAAGMIEGLSRRIQPQP